MSGVDGVGSSSASGLPAIQRFAPEPSSNLGSTFSRVLSTAGSVASQLVGGIGGIGPVTDLPSGYSELLNEQIRVQMEMQLLSFHSNIEKSKHETSMAAVRNIRAG